MTPERAALRKKYTPEMMRKLRQWFDDDVKGWTPTQKEAETDIQCVSTERGPWPEKEWEARTKGDNPRPCLHEDVLTQFIDRVVNKIDMNPMGIEAHPAGQGATKESAEFTENRIRQWEYEEKAPHVFQGAVVNACRSSYAAWKLETSYAGKAQWGEQRPQKIKIVEIDDPLTVIPGFFKKKDASDMRRCWEIERLSQSEFWEKYGDKASIKSFDGLDKDAGKWINNEAKTVQVANLWHLEEDERELLRLDPGDGSEHIDAYADEFEGGIKALEGHIVERRQENRRKVFKTVLNGVEALDETEWIDPGAGDDCPPEIPVIFTFGRIKYEHGERVIESMVRKGRVGQMRYDALISAAQEVINMTPKVKVQGPEGTFDTSTQWATIHRNPTAYAEYKLVQDPESGQTAKSPEWVTYEPPIQALEVEKQSILIGIQNAIGMSSTERTDRAAKSGKALDKLAEDMEVATAHYFIAKSQAQERTYRILERCLPVVEGDRPEVGIRDKFGKHQMVPVNPEYYQASHSIAVGVGKLYQTQQEKQEETADQLMQTKDPQILLAVLPGAIRMKIPGEWGDQIADMIEAIQPPQMQQARQAQNAKIPPQVVQAQQQAQQAVKALNAHAQQLEQRIIELEDEKRGKIAEMTFQKEMREDDNKTKIAVAAINASVKEGMDALDAQVQYIKNLADTLTARMQMGQSATDSQAQRDHDARQADLQRQHTAQQGEADRQNQQQLSAAQIAARAQEQPIGAE